MYACMTPVGFDTSDKFENHCCIGITTALGKYTCIHMSLLFSVHCKFVTYQYPPEHFPSLDEGYSRLSIGLALGF